MRIRHAKSPAEGISRLKYHIEEDRMRLTFLWPIDIEQVYIFKTEKPINIAEADLANGHLLTLQEYKRQSGYTAPLPSGTFIYSVFPFIREDGEDIAIVCPGEENPSENTVEITGQIPIQISIAEKTSFLKKDKLYIVTILARQNITGDILCYVKKLGGYPANVQDGTIYLFGDGLIAGEVTRWEIRTRKDEYIRVFVRDESLAGTYLLKNSQVL